MKIAFLFYHHMTPLDAIGPLEVLCRLPDARVVFVATEHGPITSDSGGVQLVADSTLDEVDQCDILVVPGGGTATDLSNAPRTLEWIQAMHSTTTYTISVCTGSLILGRAGLLRGKRATSHWACIDRLTRYGAVPVHQRVVQDGKIWTGAGVSAGIDMALFLAEKISGTQVAQRVQLGIEYDPAPPFDCGSPDKAPAFAVAAIRARLESMFDVEPQ